MTKTTPVGAPMSTLAQRRLPLIESALCYLPQMAIESLELAAGGNSRETWIVQVRRGDQLQKIVFRCDPDHWIRPLEMQREIAGLRLARAAGVPVPGLLLSSEEADIGRPFLITEYVQGTAIARRVLRDAEFETVRSNFAADCGRILARLHGAVDLAQDWPAEDPLEDLEKHRSMAAYPSPVLLGAMSWLGRTRPSSPARLSPVHRDFRLGNLMISSSGIVAVLDWETCHRSDPYEDLAWLCSRAWRYGGKQPVGGIGSLADLLSAYEEHSGAKVDRTRLHWWQVYASVRWGLASGARPRAGAAGDALEEAGIARQLCRQEYYVLQELRELL